MVERVDEGEGGGAVERPAVIEGRGDADGGLVRVWDAEVDFAHDCGVEEMLGCFSLIEARCWDFEVGPK